MYKILQKRYFQAVEKQNSWLIIKTSHIFIYI
jgi:hypothetical protein